MAIAVLSWMLAIPLLGLTTGLRSMTPMAVLCWYAYGGYLPVDTWAAWTSRLPVAIVFTVLAVGELVADKMPWVPNRTSLGPMLFRLLLGSLAGAITATAMAGPGVEGVLLGGLGALLGTYGGFMVRRDLVEKFQRPDWMIAGVEDLFAIFGAIYALRIVTE